MNNFQFLTIILFISPLLGLAQNVSGRQGICGDVKWLEGNQMPGPDVSVKEGKPIVRELYIFPAVKVDQTIAGPSPVFLSEVKAKPIKKVMTQKDGTFRVRLKPGKYSIFTLEPDGYWANIYDGDGYINPVTVRTAQCTTIHILINYKAYY